MNRSHLPLLPTLLLPVLLSALILPASNATAQNLPDRTVVLDPLAEAPAAEAPAAGASAAGGFSWLNATRLYGEFSRYSDGSGPNHRWNAKTGGYLELARWDSTWSIALVGTMEMVADPLSDIAFNPRAIFWEEGILASARTGQDAAFQFGYVHRCKHDIDNLETLLILGRREQSTLIYSGVMARFLLRPRVLVSGDVQVLGGATVRNDFYVHLFDQREPREAERTGRSMNTLANTVNVSARIDVRPAGARYGLHLNAGWMLSFFGSGEGLAERWKGLDVLGSVPCVEMGLDLFNPHGAAFTAFVRGEWQRDGHVVPHATSATLFLMGLRVSSFASMW